MDKIISQTRHGRVFICPSCDKVHIEFHNFLFSFNQEEFNHFKQCFSRMDGQYYEAINADIVYQRKIIVPIGHKHASMMLNRQELNELKRLLSVDERRKDPSVFLSVREIGVHLGAN
ncbi:MAG: hypothetical protein N4A71_19695 [Carboxylicivirga sp.]|jgi:hypothetical protein|nr:hypothetical protein [Carboxylicivirga sp.]MCT4646452.1 hypothetical protein [Carboxylicivirga sp.]